MPRIAARFHEDSHEIVEGSAESGLVFLCDHATARIPADHAGLGLDPRELGRHIAYDIGAEAVTRSLARHFDAPAVLSRFSRLLIDPNRGEDDPTLVMRIADGAIIPGNATIGPEEIRHRIDRFYRPYDAAIQATLTAIAGTGRPPIVVAMHSFTPEMKGVKRPWHVTVIWDFDPRLNRRLLDSLAGEPGLIVGENEPYQGGYTGDTIDRHCLSAGYAHALVEVRQDLIATPEDAEAWGNRLARHLRPLVSNPDLREARRFGAHPQPRSGGKRP
ncbi:MAG: N-formylglutamate amidohydrolase [Beijerinckiaceae bacterium]|nr:N-formylglutamate amidohydrolase [Beijerinckiaceae bacterium]